MSDRVTIGAVVLTFNRQDLARELVRELATLGSALHEIVLVDNCSTPPVQLDGVAHDSARIRLVRLESNLGAAGRNEGIAAATADIVVTLDDDISGLQGQSLEIIRTLFADHKLAGVCFKVLDAGDGKQINWCHHYPIEEYADRQFPTNEISEGAVAFRRAYVKEAGMYPRSFFISHEGPDLAFRLWNRGYRVIYDPRIAVNHSTAVAGRASWRRYYFDTRNVFWLAARNYPLGFAIKKVGLQVAAMAVYSLRDRFLIYWMKGVWDALTGLPRAFRHRERPRRETMVQIRFIESHRPPFWRRLRERLGQRTVRI